MSLSFHHRNIHQVAIEMFKFKQGLSPPFMDDIFSVVNRNTRSGESFTRPNVDSVKNGVRSLRTFGPIVWNTMLPNNLKTCDNLDDFKNALRSWVPKNCQCELCKIYIGGYGYAQPSDIFE